AAFNYSNGSYPDSNLIMDSAGNLYGTTRNDGASNYGTVFELAKGSGTITTLASVNNTNGANPDAGLMMDASGNLYGTTSNGGEHNYGTVFELAKLRGALPMPASFNYSNGTYPDSNLIMDGGGNLYGTTTNGGANSNGTVFELAQGSGTITTLA